MNSINGTTKICFVLGSHCIAHTDLELEVLLFLPPKAALQVCSSTATKDSLAEGPVSLHAFFLHPTRSPGFPALRNAAGFAQSCYS